MIQGIGVDIIELDRIAKLIEENGKMVRRILTDKEQERFLSLTPQRQIEFLAGRFAAKEAFSKAMGTGIGKHVSFQDLEILPDEKNKPHVYTSLFEGQIHVSISHSREFAVAQIILEAGQE